jgi:DNA-binding LytR/AlgR family response regulator
MIRKLQCILVDDDRFCHEIIYDLLSDCPIAELSNAFLCPKKFLAEEHALKFDVCLLDICMPDIDGFSVAHELKKNKRTVIFISSVHDKLLTALEMVEPIDVVPKPIKRERLYVALEKAYKIIAPVQQKQEYGLFYVAGEKGKIRIQLSDILFVRTDASDHRHKHIILKSGEKYILMDCSFEKLISLSPSLIRVNKSELISLESFTKVDEDTITLKGVMEAGKPKQVTLNRWFKKDFLARTSFR